MARCAARNGCAQGSLRGRSLRLLAFLRWTGLPPITEALFRNGAEIAGARPAAGHAGQVGELVVALEDRLAYAREPLSGFVAVVALKDGCGGLHSDVFGGEFSAERLLLLANDAAAQMDQHLRDVDLYGTDFVACAAERRGKRQRARVLQRLQLRGE